MQDETTQTLLFAIRDDLALLSALHGTELTDEAFDELKALDFPQGLGLVLQAEAAQQYARDLHSLVHQYTEQHSQALLNELAADFAGIYLNTRYGASPQESYWLDDEQLVMQDPMFEVRKIYRKHGLQAENWRVRADDHLVNELSFLSTLFDQEPAPSHLDTAATFLDEHLLRWLDHFAERVSMRCETRFYAHLALLTWHYCDELRDVLAELLAVARPTPEEIEERLAKTPSVQVPPPSAFAPGMKPSW